MRIVAERRGQAHLDPGAGEIDRHVEGVAAAGEAEAAVPPRSSSTAASPTQTTRGFRSLMVMQPSPRSVLAPRGLRSVEFVAVVAAELLDAADSNVIL